MKNRNFNKYLFCYFTGNEPENESVHFAVSKDGLNFTPLNGNERIITQTLGTKCSRDPFIFRGENGKFYIIATDMKCSLGWDSNNKMIVWESENLLDWNAERLIDMTDYEETKDADRVWAPEVIFDEKRNEYMIYWSHRNKNSNGKTLIWYAYSKDLKTLSTKPKILFEPKNGLDAIDADIVFENGVYYMYYKDEFNKTICYAYSSEVSGEYKQDENSIVSSTKLHVEGNCAYKHIGFDEYIMIMDKYVDGGYYMQKTKNMVDFFPVPENEFSINHLRPRHGSMLLITDKEYDNLVKNFE